MARRSDVLSDVIGHQCTQRRAEVAQPTGRADPCKPEQREGRKAREPAFLNENRVELTPSLKVSRSTGCVCVVGPPEPRVIAPPPLNPRPRKEMRLHQ